MRRRPRLNRPALYSWPALDRRRILANKKKEEKTDGTTKNYRFGKIFFEETGKTVPYVIAPTEYARLADGIDNAAPSVGLGSGTPE